MNPSCKTCIHWERAKPYAWGNCTAELPIWDFEIIDSPTGMISPGDEERAAEDCVLFTPPERDLLTAARAVVEECVGDVSPSLEVIDKLRQAILLNDA